MPLVSQQDCVPYTPLQMYQLVNQVDQYPSFVPWCDKTNILYHDDQVMVAKLSFNFQGIRQSFTTRNTLDEPNKIVIELVKGPFKKLEGTWRFHPIETDHQTHCQILLDLEYEFSNHIVAVVFEPAFAKLSGMLIESFKQQAANVYA